MARFKVFVVLVGNIIERARAEAVRMLYCWRYTCTCSTCRWRRTCAGFRWIDWKRLAWAWSTRAGMLEGSVRRKVPCSLKPLYSRSILALSFSAVMPRHEGTAYISRAIVVAYM